MFPKNWSGQAELAERRVFGTNDPSAPHPQTDENTEIVEVVEQQNQEEPPKEEAPEPVKEPEPAPVQEEPKEEPAPAPEPVKEPEPAPAPEAPKAEEPKAEPAPAPVTEEPKAEPAPEAPKAEEPKAEPALAPVTEEPKAEEPKKEEETKAETKTEEPKVEEKKTEDVKPEEKPVEQPAEEAPAADEVKKENITVRIEWEDEDNALGLRPTTLAVTLSGSDGQTYSAKIAEKDGWQHTFADLTTQRGAEVIYYSVDADDAADYDKDVRGLTVTYTCTAQPVVDEQPDADDENLIDDQMDGDPAELPDGDGPTVTETEDGTVIGMGETAEEPVEGEEANAEKPEEDGELDEDFTLPEEGELPEEDAEPEIPEIDFSTLSVAISAESDVVELGGDMVLTAILTGFEDLNYTLQWQFSTDNANWANVDGATGSTLRVQMNEENCDYFWRVSVDNISWKNLPVVQTEQPLEAAEPAAAEPAEPAEAAETGAQE